MKLLDLQFYQKDGQVRVKKVYKNEEHSYAFLNGHSFTQDELHYIECDLRALFEKSLQLGQQREAKRIREKLGIDLE